MKLLITSVGSLLGQNILDSIEGRRNLIHVAGTNSVAENPRNFRCDAVYLVSETHDDDFLNDFLTVVQKENPDFILPGRDEDCVFLSDFKSNYPEGFGNKIPFGNSLIPKVMLDKYQSYLFCKKNHLAFADTFLFATDDDKTGLDEFINKHGFPILVKPREGFASVGVSFVLNHQQVDEITRNGEALFQEYLGNPDDIFKYKDIFKKGIPLFFQIPEKEQYAAQTIISHDGTISEVFFTINTMIHGRAEFSKPIFNKDVEELVHRFCDVFYKNGWVGPVNFQLKPDKKGNWKVFELNPRLTGTSSGRALLGYDEFGILADIFVPELKIPNLTQKEKVKGNLIKYLTDNLLLDENVEMLKTFKIWKKS